MLQKDKRLNWKDIIFLTKKRQFIPGGIFWFFYVKQYPNRKYNQLSSHITIKLDKRATRRRIIKRAIIDVIEKQWRAKTPIKGSYYKIFIILNKKKLEDLQKLIASKDKNAIIKYVKKIFSQSFSNFQHRVWK
jgi:uncharacterized membrane-anchored protein YitT (DUF2179 family)